jgi:hypothetical protein
LHEKPQPDYRPYAAFGEPVVQLNDLQDLDARHEEVVRWQQNDAPERNCSFVLDQALVVCIASVAHNKEPEGHCELDIEEQLFDMPYVVNHVAEDKEGETACP